MQIFRKYPYPDAVVIKLLKHLGLKINPQDVISELERHPDHPSLLAISDVLNWFKVSNAAYRVNADDIAEIPTPFIAHTHPNDDFVVVSRIAGDKIILSDDKRDNYTISLEEFKRGFKGVVLIAETSCENAGIQMQTWPDRLAPYKTPVAALVLGISFIITLVYHSQYFLNLSWQVLFLTIFKTAGLITSILLLVQSIDKSNPLVQTFCGGDLKTNCNSILLSKAATVFNGLTWSEVGFFYFSGTWLLLLFGSGSIGMLQCLVILNILSLPYTVYSIYYQASVAKQWCLLCTIVQALLWLEFITLMIYPIWTSLQTYFIFELASLEFMICLLIPVSLWLIVKPLLLNTQKLRILKDQLRKFKYNTELFYNTLKEQPKYELPHEDWSILLGNLNANIIITMVSNPYCPPCSKTHQLLDEWLNFRNDIQLRIVFATDNNGKDSSTIVARHLMTLNKLSDRTIIKNALQDWYAQKQKSYESWARRFPVNLDEQVFKMLDKQKEWCIMADVKATPTLLINGIRLPGTYQVNDIRYMLN